MKEKPLELRINDLERECRRLVKDRAVELSKGTGVPSVVLEAQLLTGKSAFEAALSVIETKRKDAEIAEREYLKEHKARQGARL